jgi:transaldolase/glucose-6-phosphate isomerase
MTRIHEITKLGQSIWYDNIRRALLESGELKSLVEQGVRGVTSNPTIFEKAIGGSNDYDHQFIQLVQEGKSVTEIFEALAIEDIAQTADILRPVYDESAGADGFVSLEVNPLLAHSTDTTISEARRLFAAVQRPNVMIKVPATPEGVPAIETLIGEGININVTLIFSIEQYVAVANAYIAGLEKFAMKGGDLSKVASVASFFVSRVDTNVDKQLEKIGDTELLGKIAIANAKVAYEQFCNIFGGERWEKLALKGARPQRPLWASTGTKNPNYPDTLYIDTLIGPHTVNTVPPATLQAILDHANVASTLEVGVEEAHAQIKRLGELGIGLNVVTQQLLDEGVASFSKSFETLMDAIETKRAKLLDEWEALSPSLGSYQAAVEAALDKMYQANVLSRIWAFDHTVWSDNPDEITNRLGWLHIANVMAEQIPEITTFVDEVRKDGFTHALLLGMGGSSLAPEVFRKTFGVTDGYLDLAVLDSTDPEVVLSHARRLDLSKTLFIVSTKSGGTVETFSFFKYFYNKVAEVVGKEKAGQHFIAITDPGSGLATTAEQYKFRKTFLNDPNIGGRYSALSHFGLVPAALVGVDLTKLLDRAHTMSVACDKCVVMVKNISAVLGTIMGELAKEGRDKVTIVLSHAMSSFGDWVEQLIAESTGKNDKGILPVVGEPLGSPSMYGSDRLFVYLRLEGDSSQDAAIAALEEAGHPVVRIMLDDAFDLGGQFFLWEMATAVAGHVLGINPFDQPNVESAKVLARKMVAAYTESGQLPTQKAALSDKDISVFGDVTASSAGGALVEFISKARPGDYISLQAYLPPTPQVNEALKALRSTLYPTIVTGKTDSLRPKLATTLGYGPRFLHSTGQLHKGDGGNGLFIQFTSDPLEDAPIPEEAGKPGSSITFGVLKMAQALGDAQALLDNGRRVIRFHLGKDVVGSLKRLTAALS